MKKRLHAYYQGNVQGVGFRFTLERLAASMGLTGWVKNLEDGRVEIVVEGDESGIRKVLAGIASVFKDYIRDADIEWGNPTNEFEAFDIRFDR